MMLLFRDAAALEARRAVAHGPLSPLADALAAELRPWHDAPLAPAESKARLSRQGGRCPSDQGWLAFDPASPHRHRCPRCARWFEGADHDGWWVYGYQLWLAERATQAALLYALRGDVVHREMAARILRQCADQYARWPNRDNVLGPSRPFFSTYIESLWLLQLTLALDLIEGVGPADRSLGSHVRDRLVDPSRALISSYPEGDSNRQAWNAAACACASLLLDDRLGAEAALSGPVGTAGLIARGLLDDGSWYEGENYHQFAWRGLWFGVQLADVAGIEIDAALLARFDRGASALVRTVMPDLTLPSRRDSPYRTSLRQWRYAEMLELALARNPQADDIGGTLARLYADDIAVGETGRARSTGEAERNELPTRLTRADLGWKALAFALPALPASRSSLPQSALLPAQGLAILRRDQGRAFVALDYGDPGGGHGHPDRLNLLLTFGSTRWLDDVGTGSYTSHDLFWYRSSVAHNAPIVDGRTQASAAGHLLAWEERDDIGWASAEADALSPGVTLRRTVVVMADYLVDELHWRSDRAIALDLPLHADGIFSPVLPWQPSDIALPAEADAGYGFLRRIEAAAWPIGEAPVLHAVRGTERATVRWLLPEGASVWRAEGPGEPGESSRRFHAVRAHGREGTIVAIWDWTGNAVRDASVDGGALVVRLRAGARHVHRRVAEGWSVEIADNGRSSHVVLGGLVQPPVPAAARFTRETQRGDESRRAPIVLMPNVPWSAALGEDHWRQTEDGWADAARPTATVAIRDDMHALHLAVSVSKASPTFAGAVTENPLDNEHSDINSDGLQLHRKCFVATCRSSSARPTLVRARAPTRPRPRRECRGWRATRRLRSPALQSPRRRGGR